MNKDYQGAVLNLLSEVDMKSAGRRYCDKAESGQFWNAQKRGEPLPDDVWIDENGDFFRLDRDAVPSMEELRTLAALLQAGYARRTQNMVCGILAAVILLVLFVIGSWVFSFLLSWLLSFR